jgi:branched-chain amino acid transport system substrate-binding protein
MSAEAVSQLPASRPHLGGIVIKKLSLVVTLIVVLGLATALVLSACGASGGTSSNTTNDQSTEGFDGGTITIGAPMSMTGPGAMNGTEQKWAYDQAVSDTNAAGGITMNGKKYKIELKYADDQSDPIQVAAAMEQLIKVDGLKLILSSQTTPVNQAAATVAEKYKVYYQAVISWSDWMEKEKYSWVSNMFFTPAIAAAVPFDMVKTMPASEAPKKFGMFTEDNADGQGLAGGVAATAKAMGYEYAITQAATPGGKDYSAAILKLKNAGVDGLLAFCSPADAITFVKQMKEANYSPKFFFGWKGFWPVQIPQGLGSDSDFLGHDGFWSMDLGYPGAKELGDKYAASHDGATSVSIGLCYASAQVLFKAIENANSTEPAAVRDAVWGQTFTGTTMGDVTYNDNGICVTPGVGSEWVNNGTRALIVPKTGGAVPLEWFVPWDQR